MKITRASSSSNLEDRIVFAAAKSRAFMAHLTQALRGREQMVMESPIHQRALAFSWDHFEKYGEPIGVHWDTKFEIWCKSASKEDVEAAKSLRDAVEGLDPRGVTGNPRALADEALNHFLTNSVRERMDGLRVAIDRNSVDLVRQAIQNLEDATRLHETSTVFHGGESTLENISKVLDDTEHSDPLFTFPGHAGGFFNSEMKRGRLVSFIGPEKSGKTHWLIEVAYQALLKDRYVLYLNAGDLLLGDFYKRMSARICNRPYFPGDYSTPVVADGFGSDGIPKTVNYLEVSDCLDLSRDIGAQKRVLESRYVRGLPKLRTFESPIDTLKVSDIEKQVHHMREKDGWYPDVIVVDYADILAPEDVDARKDFRHQVNSKWMSLRRLSQSTHTLVLTATQTNRAAYGAKSLISRENAAEDKRILAHLNAMIGINQTPEEKENQIYRLNYPVVREKNISERTVLRTAGCVGFSHPLMMARLETPSEKCKETTEEAV